MVYLGLEPGAAGWKAQTNPLSYGGTSKMLKAATILLLVFNECRATGDKLCQVIESNYAASLRRLKS